MDHQTEQTVRSLAGQQHWAISRKQALAAGMTAKEVALQVRTKKWQNIHPGVYATHNAKVDWWTRAWAAVLYAGKGAALSHYAAAYVWGLEKSQPAMLTVSVPAERTVKRQPGFRVMRRRRVEVVRRKRLPVTSIRQTVLDLTAQAGFTLDDTAALLGRAAQKNLLEPSALLELLDAQHGHPMSNRLRAACADAAEGVESSLESRILRHVIRAHGLPGFRLQDPLDVQDQLDDDSRTPSTSTDVRPPDATENRSAPGGAPDDGVSAGGRRVRRCDLRNRALGIRIEGDGVAWHGGDRFHEDRRRDRQAAARGEMTLRVTWDAAEDPCQVALDVASTMAHRGWDGVPTPCSPACDILEQWSARTQPAGKAASSSVTST
ncbi:hypothetical protein MWU75_14470 [Ornithinimicrobium sp. F0845]|uniref:type IV toxin-antitoxin system AbiEi family antitoxin domain-containing protein n=1 Tax=Ornithinimicrobium sp. F0845 TaxID=2926412 RepID=UPI001FF19881|nr:type IV toxin-antitoxin system AbiEi family antitoxin domain-containing protein [Ornithinimicrobium sp. F0845]MCK0113351.1 hypothetical protein [Ornithinimicrobium sp. F0845]